MNCTWSEYQLHRTSDQFLASSNNHVLFVAWGRVTALGYYVTELCQNSHVVMREAQATTSLFPICIGTTSFSEISIVISAALGFIGTLFHCSFTLVGPGNS